jgi:polyphenol oxidase
LTAAAPREVTAPLVLQAPAAPVSLTTAPVTRSVTLPPQIRAHVANLAASAPPEYILHVRGITVPESGQAMFNVFLNEPNATAASGVESPNFVGTVTVLARTKKSGARHEVTTNAAFDITDVLADLKGPETLSVTLVPVAAGGAAPSAQQASFKQISIETH